MWETIFKCGAIYLIVAVILALWNSIQLLRCAAYRTKYEDNLNNHVELKNAVIKPGVQSLCKSTKEWPLHCGEPDWLVRQSYFDENSLMFANMGGKFIHRIKHSFIWPKSIIDKFVMHVSRRRRKTKSKFSAFIYSLLGVFGSYTVCRLCDSTGYGDMLDAFSLRLREWVLQLFQK